LGVVCAVKDACSKRIVGYSIDARMTSDLAVNALRKALALCGAVGAIVHSEPPRD
jgi:putative transposase